MDQVERELVDQIQSANEAMIPGLPRNQESTLRQIGDRFNLDLNAINWEEYKFPEGVEFGERLPSDSLVVLVSRNLIIGINTRDKVRVSSSHTLTRDRDYKRVDIERIPIKQLLGQAKSIYIIPLSDLESGGRVSKSDLVKSRYRSKPPTELVRVPGSYSADKSGYYSKVNRRLREYKLDKKENLAKSIDLAPEIEGLYKKVKELANVAKFPENWSDLSLTNIAKLRDLYGILADIAWNLKSTESTYKRLINPQGYISEWMSSSIVDEVIKAHQQIGDWLGHKSQLESLISDLGLNFDLE